MPVHVVISGKGLGLYA